ncbi:hypothetical protein A6R68_09723, partial [Neotoma lepida]
QCGMDQPAVVISHVPHDEVPFSHDSIVAGVNYYLEVELGRTTCTKSQPNLTDCPFHDQPHLMRLCWVCKARELTAWCSEKDEPYVDKPVSDPDTVKFALSTFNNQSKEEQYRLDHTMRFSKVQEKLPETFFMKLRLRRTICKKFKESLDTCPFQDNPELENVRQDTRIHPFHSCGCCWRREGVQEQ